LVPSIHLGGREEGGGFRINHLFLPKKKKGETGRARSAH